MVKGVYATLFQLLVNRINLVLSAGKTAYKNFIGVLDIFGFESFKISSFEQLCINYCNEKLCGHISGHFSDLQSSYVKDGVVHKIEPFFGNLPVLSIFEGTNGIIALANKATANIGLITDLYKLNPTASGGNANALTVVADDIDPRPPLPFGVIHYAGTIIYDATDFLEKNNDQLNIDIIGVLKASTSPLVKDMFSSFVDRDTGFGSGKGKNDGVPVTNNLSEVRAQMNALLTTLANSTQHFVYCIRPNHYAFPVEFDSNYVYRQLQSNSLEQVANVYKSGYPFSFSQDEFLRRYRCINVQRSTKDLKDLLLYLEKEHDLYPGEWRIGKTKVFLRAHQFLVLQRARTACEDVYATRIIKRCRMSIFWRKIHRFSIALAKIQSAVTSCNMEALTKALDESDKLPYGGLFLDVVKKAKAMLKQLLEEKRVVESLLYAINNKSLIALQTSLKNAVDLSKSEVNSAIIAQAQDMLARLGDEDTLKKEVAAAVKERNIEALDAALAKAEAAQFTSPETKQAASMRSQILKGNLLLKDLSLAMEGKDAVALGNAVSDCVAFGLENHPDVVAANSYKYKLILSSTRGREQRTIKERQDREAQEAAEKFEREERVRLHQEAELQAFLEAQMEEERIAAAKKRAEEEALVVAVIEDGIKSHDRVAVNHGIDEAIRINLNNGIIEKARIFLENMDLIEECTNKLEMELHNLESFLRMGIDIKTLSHLLTLTSDPTIVSIVITV